MRLEQIFSHNPEAVALRDRHKIVCYGDLKQEVELRANQLRDVDVLGIALDNGIEWVLWDLAALRANVVTVPLPPFFSPDQISHTIKLAGISHIIDKSGIAPTGLSASTHIPHGTAKITFTSGTTGRPKGVCLPINAMEDVAHSISRMLGSDFIHKHLSVLPLSILLENVAGVYTALLSGASVDLCSLQEFGQSYENLHEIIKETAAESVVLVPEILRSLMKQVIEKGPLSDLKFVAVGGSKVDPALLANAHALGLPVYEGYGLSECASVVSLNTPSGTQLGSVGRLLPHVKASIKDGQIVIHHPGFLGYIGDPAPKQFPTGDLGSIDEDGYVHVTGRSKNVLITSYGRNVSPEWVEAALLAQPEILQAIVYGDAMPHLGALIVPSSPLASIDNAIHRANTALPAYAQIKESRSVPPFTQQSGFLTGNGRPRRQDIYQHYLTPNENEVRHVVL